MRTLRHISVRRGQHYHRSETSPALTNPLLLHPEKLQASLSIIQGLFKDLMAILLFSRTKKL